MQVGSPWKQSIKVTKLLSSSKLDSNHVYPRSFQVRKRSMSWPTRIQVRQRRSRSGRLKRPERRHRSKRGEVQKGLQFKEQLNHFEIISVWWLSNDHTVIRLNGARGCLQTSKLRLRPFRSILSFHIIARIYHGHQPTRVQKFIFIRICAILAMFWNNKGKSLKILE